MENSDRWVIKTTPQKPFHIEGSLRRHTPDNWTVVRPGVITQGVGRGMAIRQLNER